MANTKKTTRKKQSKKKKLEFGKFITLFVLIFCFINFEAIVITSFVLMFIIGDLTPLSEMLIGTFAVVTTVASAAVGFYQWKSKAENIIKLKKFLGLPIKSEDITGKNTENYEDFPDETNLPG